MTTRSASSCPWTPCARARAVLRGSANALKRSLEDDPRQRTAAALSVRSSPSATDQGGPGETEDCADACDESRPAAAGSAAVARTRSTAGQTGGERAGTARRTIKAPDVPDSAPAIPGPRAGPPPNIRTGSPRLDGARRVSEPAGTRTEPRWSPRQPGGHPARPQVSFTHIWYSGIFRCAGCNRLRCGSEVRCDVAASAPRLSAETEHL